MTVYPRQRRIVSRCECIDIDNAVPREDLVVDIGWKVLAAQPKPNVAATRRFKQRRFEWVDAFEQLGWVAPT